ncbi:lipase member H-like [Augochlora pura]
MARSRLFSIFAICCCVFGHASLSAAQGTPTAAEDTIKNILSFPLNAIIVSHYEKDFSVLNFQPNNGAYASKYLNATKKTIIHCHGYLQSTDNPYVKNLIQGYVTGYDYNVLAVDYRFVTFNFYPTSVLLADAVAGVIQAFVEGLVNGGVKQEDLILSGFSLGAQIMAKVARNLPFKIHELLALDPAGPMFDYMGRSVSASDALCVKCVHSDEHYYGTFQPCGHLDFYPNGGSRNQPGCSMMESMAACSHERATQISAEAAQKPDDFPAIQCQSWSQFKHGRCNTSSIIPFGLNAPCNASGKFYLQTNPQKPYGRGKAGIVYDSSLEDNDIFG